MNDQQPNIEVLEPEAPEAPMMQMISAAEISQQISTAKRYPRTLSKVKADMLSFATLDEETAGACFYTLPRGGKSIQGPSVRLAEIAVACYGNLRVGSRIISTVTNGDSPHVVVQSVAHDLEKNTAISIEKRRRIVGKKDYNTGTRKAPDEDDINLATNACSAIAFRDAVFKVVPQALIQPVLDAAKKCAIGDIKSLSEKRNKVVDRLKQMGVPLDRILHQAEARKIDDIDYDKLEVLIGLGTSLKDGNTTLEAAFPPVPMDQDDSGLGPQQPTEPAAPATGNGGSAPAEPKQTKRTPMAQETFPNRLGTAMVEAGINFDTYRNWGTSLGQFEGQDPSSWDGFSQVPSDVAKKHFAARESIIAAINKTRKEPA